MVSSLDRAVSAAEAERYLGIKADTIKKWVRRGVLNPLNLLWNPVTGTYVYTHSLRLYRVVDLLALSENAEDRLARARSKPRRKRGSVAENAD